MIQTIILPRDANHVPIQLLREQVFDTMTPLGASGEYVSPVIDGSLFRRITGRVFADQAGTLKIQHSEDGVTWDTTTSIAVTANEAKGFDEIFFVKFVRVVFTNEITAQTVFRLTGYRSTF